MNLYILRHASAGLRRTNPILDFKRPLDKEGKKQCLQLAHVLNALNIQFDLIVSSPLKRCLQTASLVGTETGYEAQIMNSTALAPEGTLKDFQNLLSECSKRENLLVVGHNPNLTNFLGALLVPATSAVTPNIRLRKGTLARLSLTRRPAVLQGLLDPRTIRALYATSTKSSRRKTSRK
jgi:phosphohistidine phosphatase